MNNIDRRTALIVGIASASLVSGTTGFAQNADANSAESKLRELGIELPKVPTPVANYLPATRLGNLIFLAGTGPRYPDGRLGTGKVGVDLTADEAYQHAKLVGITLLAMMR